MSFFFEGCRPIITLTCEHIDGDRHLYIKNEEKMALRRKVVKGVRIQGNQHTITSFKWKKQRQEVDEKQKKKV